MSVLLQLGIAQTCSGGVFHHPPSPQPPAHVSWGRNRVFSIMQVPRWEAAAAAPGSPGAFVSVGALKQKITVSDKTRGQFLSYTTRVGLLTAVFPQFVPLCEGQETSRASPTKMGILEVPGIYAQS